MSVHELRNSLTPTQHQRNTNNVPPLCPSTNSQLFMSPAHNKLPQTLANPSTDGSENDYHRSRGGYGRSLVQFQHNGTRSSRDAPRSRRVPIESFPAVAAAWTCRNRDAPRVDARPDGLTRGTRTDARRWKSRGNTNFHRAPGRANERWAATTCRS